MTPESEALLDLLAPDAPDVTVNGWRDSLRTRLAAIEAAARSDARIAVRVETEWVNGNLSDDVRDRILGDDR